MRRILFLVAAAVLIQAAPGSAAPARRKPAKPASAAPQPRLVKIAVLPAAVLLDGARSLQGLVVTGTYSDGRVRDVTERATFRVNNPRVAAVRKEETRRVLRPVADGRAAVKVAVTGVTPVEIPVEVKNAGEVALVSFRHEVIPALTKLGCNTGTCHGTPTGKGGFRLSLQGYAPELDYNTLAREGGGRRVNPAEPGASLLLMKPMVAVPHAGGKRLWANRPEFDILVRWISEGARDDPPSAPALERVEVLPGRRQLKLPGVTQQVVALAHFSDGSTRDVTHLAKLNTSDEEIATITREGLVEAQKRGDIAVLVRYQDALVSMPLTFLQDVPGFRWNNPPVHNYIDQAVFDRLKLFQIPVSGLSSDTEFLRRAYLDAIGRLPTPEEVRRFLADSAPERREKLVDWLTEQPEFADLWALRWADVLRIQDETLKEKGAKEYHRWVRDSIAANKPMDQFVREILTASGPTFSNPPANYFRAIDEPENLSQTTAQLFLGVRMECAKCHNHPFERWTQDEYYALAAFFSQVRRKKGPEKDEETVTLTPRGQVRHLRTGQVMRPKLLGAGYPEIPEGADRRVALAEWITRKDNPFFAKAIVNRAWANLVGRGIVEPIDDFRDSNPPVNEALLEALAKDFVAHGFNFRYLVRTIMKSRTYQLTARTLPLNKDDNVYFSHALPRMLQAEVLADAIAQVTAVADTFEGHPAGTRAVQLAGTKARTPFLKVFGRPDRNLACECEREKDPTLFQALALISGRNVHGKLKSDSGRVAKLVGSNLAPAQVVEELFLSSVSRFPTDRERAELTSYLEKAEDRRQALEDVAWALINSKEFLFRH